MINDETISRVREVIHSRFGLDYPETRSKEMIQGLTEAANELGFESFDGPFEEKIRTDTISREEMSVIASHLTIGETYFFREPVVLQALRDMILPQLIRERAHSTRKIRIWSAGCSSGEEPYSLAMILTELLPDLPSWSVTLLATDINPRALEKAKKGRYTAWSFRGTPDHYKNRYFNGTGKEFEIIPAIREMVTFFPLNLAEEVFPSAITNTGSIDLLFCRNVLMYFSAGTARQVAVKLHHSMAEGGWFFPSQVELSDDLFPELEKIRYKTVYLYRKNSSIRNPVGTPPLLRQKKPAVQQKKANPVESGARTADEQRLSSLEQARQLASSGNGVEALAMIQSIIDRQTPEAGSFYLAGMILSELGQPLEAQAMFSRALYIDPKHLLSHFQMMVLTQRNGHEKKSAKHRQNLVSLLTQYANEEPLPDGEGMTAGEFRNLLGNQME